MLLELVNDLQHLLALREHAYRRVEVPTDDAGARRLCDDVLLHESTRPITTTELAMARYILLRIGPDGTRDSDEQRAFDAIGAYLLARDAAQDTAPLLFLMNRINHPVIAEFLAASRECRDAEFEKDDPARVHAAKRAAIALAEMRQAMADHEAACGTAGSPPYRLAAGDWDTPTDNPVANANGRAQFRECAECAAKSGSPSLCAACLHNRGIADELNRLFAAAALVHELKLTLKSRIDHRDRSAIRDLGAVVDDMIRRGWTT